MCIGIQGEMASKNDEHVARMATKQCGHRSNCLSFRGVCDCSSQEEDAVMYAQVYTAGELITRRRAAQLNLSSGACINLKRHFTGQNDRHYKNTLFVCLFV